MEAAEEQIPLHQILNKTKEPETIKSGNGFLYFAALVANLIAFTTGIAFGWTSPVLPKLSKVSDPEINPLGRVITPGEESWIAGLICLGGIFGPLLSGPVADKIGRKPTLLLVSCPILISLLLSAYVKSLTLLYIYRLIIGIGAGSVFTVLPIYLAEIAEDHNRGTLGCSMLAFTTCGLLFSFSVGPFLSIRNFCLVCCIPLTICIPLFAVWIPETPQYLASAGKTRELEISLTKLRNKSATGIQKETMEITNSILEESKKKGGISDLFKRRGLRKALIITLGAITFQQLSGINPVIAYMQSIFEATKSGLSPEISTIIIGVIQLATTIVTSYLVDRLGRRLLLLTSSIGSCLSLSTLGLYFYLKSNGYEVDAISWLPVSSLIVFVVSFNIGLGPVPWAVMAELFPTDVKSIASSLTSVMCFLAASLTTFFFPALAVVLGMAKSFWIFALVCFAATIFIYWILPETKGKSLQEIQKLLEGNET